MTFSLAYPCLSELVPSLRGEEVVHPRQLRYNRTVRGFIVGQASASSTGMHVDKL